MKISTYLRQLYDRKKKILLGFIDSNITKFGKEYKYSWWDEVFFKNVFSDESTIAPENDQLLTKYHYASVELLISRYLSNNLILNSQSTVLDIGSGAGHWIDFYLSLGIKKIYGMDVSISSVNYLKEKYYEMPNVEILHGPVDYVLTNLQQNFDLVNAIGVMFHIVNDKEWKNSIEIISKRINDSGIFIVGGYFGLLNGVNVQIDNNGLINKRLRSIFKWKKILRESEFRSINYHKNYSYLSINGSQPENNILFAKK